jgi:DNA-directed RNA polymerase alpha subunit
MCTFYISSVAHPSFVKLDAVRRSPHAGQHAVPELLPPGNRPLQLTSANAEAKTGNSICTCDLPIPEAMFSAKTYNALLRSRITTIKQLCALELADLKWLRSFGKKAEQEVIAYRAHPGKPLKAGA